MLQQGSATSNILNLVFTNQPERISDIATFDSQLTTDHLGVQFKIKTILKRERIARYVYNFKKADFEGLKQFLSVTQLDIGFVENDIDQTWESWRDLFLNAVDSHIPKYDSKTLNLRNGLTVKLSKCQDKKVDYGGEPNDPIQQHIGMHISYYGNK